MQHARSVSLALALSLLTPAAFAQTFWTVDDDGPADFSQLHLAIAAAADGDVILLRDGFYGTQFQQNVEVIGKSLTIQGDADGGASIQGVGFGGSSAFVVRDLAANQSLRVRNVLFTKFLGYEYDIVDVSNCAGPVVFEDVTIEGLGPSGRPLDLRDNASVTLVRCEITAGPAQVSTCCGGLFLGVQAFAGVSSIETNLFVYDSVITGGSGWGSYGEDTGPGPGRGAIAQRGASLLVSGSVLTGGNGGAVFFGPCYAGADGGPALDVGDWTSGSAEVRLIDNVLLSGQPSSGVCGLADGIVPPPVLDPGGVVQTIPFDARSFSLESPVEGALSATAEFTGLPGELAVLVLGVPANGLLVVPPAGLAAHLLPPFALDLAGVIPAGGTLVRNYAFPAATTPFVVSAQGAFLPAVGTFASGPSTLVATGP